MVFPLPLPTVAVEIISDPGRGGFTAFVPDLPAIGEGETEEEAISDLKKAIKLYIDEFGLEEALSRVVGLFKIREVNFGDLLAYG